MSDLEDELEAMYAKRDVRDLPLWKQEPQQSTSPLHLGLDDSLVKIDSRETYTFRSGNGEDRVQQMPTRQPKKR